MIRTAYGFGPAVASGVRGGAKVSSTVPVVPGYSRSVCGSTTVHGRDVADRLEAVLVDDVTGIAQPQPHGRTATRVHGRGRGLQGSPKAHPATLEAVNGAGQEAFGHTR